MTRHEADRTHEPSGIVFEFGGHLVWGNPRLSGRLAGDVEAWRCGRCNGLVVGAIEPHAELHTALEALREKLDNVVPGAFRPVEANAGAMPAAQMRRGAERVATWREAATVREAPTGETS